MHDISNSITSISLLVLTNFAGIRRNISIRISKESSGTYRYGYEFELSLAQLSLILKYLDYIPDKSAKRW